MQGGRFFSYQLNISTLGSAGSGLTYSLSSSDAASLPYWLNFSANNLTLSGVPDIQQDLQYNWTLSALRQQQLVAAQSFLFISSLPCPADNYRHFRVRILPAADNAIAPAAICSLEWEAAMSVFPYNASSVNISGSSGTPLQPASNQSVPDPERAFLQLGNNTCNSTNAWLVSQLIMYLT